MPHLYPVFLNLDGKTVLIVGGGTLARQKLRSLAGTAAHVALVAPDAEAHGISWPGPGRLCVARRAFKPADLEGAHLVFAATDDPAVNHHVVDLARQRGIPANAVDDPAFCDFYTPAIVRRGTVSVAIGTEGRFPGLTRALREVLEEWLPDQDHALIEALAQARADLRRCNAAPERAQVLRELVAQLRDRYLKPRPQAQRGEAAGASGPFTTRREGTHDDVYIS